MDTHPFLRSNAGKLTGLAVVIAQIAVLWGLLWLYGGVLCPAAAVYAAVYGLFLALGGYVYWFWVGFPVAVYAKVAVAVLVQAVCLADVFAVRFLTGLAPAELLSGSVPLMLVYGSLCWGVLALWYKNIRQTESTEEEVEIQKEEKTLPEGKKERLERITVKDREGIHLIPTDDLYCILAAGDYVALRTGSDEYLKEQTMKYFEQGLPDTFVRIHRSCIVNIRQIARIELSGKDVYTIRLKNGDCLRASVTGYKLLKERLSL